MNKLYRSRESSIIAGVCGGMGEYFNIDPVIVRIIFILMMLPYGIGLLIYAFCWIAVPLRPEGLEVEQVETIDRQQMRKYWPGLALILVGLIFLLSRLWDWISFAFLWPLALIILGAYLIYRSMAQKREE
jgi:phage shock protein C